MKVDVDVCFLSGGMRVGGNFKRYATVRHADLDEALLNWGVADDPDLRGGMIPGPATVMLLIL
ncbi:MAG: hypothetical protein AAGH92_06475 [Planctomycetota bacterium]